MDSKKELLLEKAYDAYINLMLYDFPIEKMSELVAEDVTGYGTALDEKILEIKRLVKVVTDQREQGAGIEMHINIMPIHRRVSPEKDTALFMDECEITMMVDDKKNIIPLRLTSVFEFIENKWMLVHLHGSKAVETEGDTWHLSEWKKQNELLQKQVEEKTDELVRKNRELEIESSLERVRAIAMSMLKPDDLLEVCQIISEQLEALDVKNIRNVQVAIIDDSRKNYANYQYFTAYSKPVFEETNYTNNPAALAMVTEMQKSANSFFIGSIQDEDLMEFKAWRNKDNQFPDPLLDKSDVAYYYFYSIGKGGLGLTTYKEISNESLEIFKRFHKVFTLAYRRFIDIQHAAAQAREAEIQLALERVRARTMAMQKSNELLETTSLIAKQLKGLGEEIDQITIGIFKEEENLIEAFGTVKGDQFQTLDMPINESFVMDKVYKEWKAGNKSLIVEISGKELIKYNKWRNKFLKKNIYPIDNPNGTWFVNAAFFSKGLLSFSSDKQVSQEANKILERFAAVFNLTYTRFLDLKKAEEQAREALIETALEKVRSRSLAMHTTNELGEVVATLVEKLKDLGVVLDANGVVLCTYFNDSRNVMHWIASPDFSFAGSYLLPYFKHPIFDDAWESKESGTEYFSKAFSKDEKDSFFKYAFEHSDYKNFPEDFKQWVFQNDQHILSFAWQKNSAILIPSHTGIVPSEEEIAILKRFAKVFEQSYVRFLDLQKAEAQARKAQVDAALDRTRSHSMQMQHSDEIKDLSKIFHEQLASLNIPSEFSYIWLPAEEKSEHLFWATWSETKGGKTITSSKSVIYPLDKKEPYTAACFDAWESDKPVHVTKIPSEEIAQFFTTWKDLIKEAKNLKAKNFPEGIYYAESYMKYGCFGINIRRTLSEEEQNILLRFTIEFERAYTRFLDLKRAEKQAREAQIEASLEKVRGVALSLQKSDEMLQVAQVLYEQLLELGFTNIRNALIDIKNGDTDTFTDYDYSHEMSGTITQMSYHDDPTLQGQFRKMATTTNDFFELVLDGKELEDLKKMRLKNGEAPDARLDNINLLTYNLYSFGNGAIGISNFGVLSVEEKSVLSRFSNVFTFAYKRYTDMVNAEAQAREVQVELSLERIRAQVTAMQESTELLDIVVSMRTEFVSLGHEAHYFWYMRYLPETYEKAMTSGDGTKIGMVMSLPRHIHGDIKLIANWEKSDEPTVVFAMDVETAVDYVHKMITLGDFKQVDPNAPTLDDIRHIGGLTFIMARTTHGEIGFSLPGPVSNPPQDSLNTLVRFAKVFDLAYSRFEDLKSAEQRNRETQIELALERVRARTMAMQHSNELADASFLLVQQVKALGIDTWGCAFNIFDENQDSSTEWFSNDEGSLPTYKTPREGIFLRYYEAGQSGETFFVEEISGKACRDHYAFLCTLPVVGDALKQLKADGIPFPSSQIDHVAYFKYGYLLFITFEPVPEAHEIFKRFAKVFEQTYTRFLDLKNAEEQARESQIEASLERVRSRALAMQKPGELVEVAQLLRTEMGLLGVEELETSSIYIHDETTGKTECWFSIQDRKKENKLVSDHMTIDLNDTWVGRQMMQFYRSDNDKFSVVMQGANRTEWIDYCAGQSDLFSVAGFYGEEIPERTYHLYKFSYGYMGAASSGEISIESWDLLKRATAVFSLAYTRFNDLQHAEARAIESIRQASLDRVRAEIASMRTAGDLNRITPLIWKELITLEVPFIRCGVFIVDEKKKKVQVYLTTPDGNPLGVLNLPFDANDLTRDTVNGWCKNKVYTTHWNKNDFISWMQSMMEIGQIETTRQYQGTAEPPESLNLHFIPFTQGMLYVGNSETLSEEKIELVKSLANAFAIAYSRYEDFIHLEEAKNQIEITLNDLKATQTQLIHAEKMASLGELTAGIAHEIQNPLNFVNNFSEVSVDLIDEMNEEIDTGNTKEVKEISKDLKQNLEKISHHGKRASSIVKGMLEHSRAGDGHKELTDINALSDEYLRLAYHGLRAKDKSFNADFKVELDKSLPKIKVIPQDIGRVLLNLINNGFYACNERSHSAVSSEALAKEDRNYKPQVIISTKKQVDKIEIRIKDNGNGIPETIKDKIFQPFFTTKPTGEGTGLGLSMSYDIITKGHNGTIEVKSEKGIGTEFLIQFPLQA